LTAVGAARGFEGLAQVVAQLVVLDQPLHVGIRARRRVHVRGAIGGLGRPRCFGHALSSLEIWDVFA
jgi:hypothetical protein